MQKSRAAYLKAWRARRRAKALDFGVASRSDRSPLEIPRLFEAPAAVPLVAVLAIFPAPALPDPLPSKPPIARLMLDGIAPYAEAFERAIPGRPTVHVKSFRALPDEE